MAVAAVLEIRAEQSLEVPAATEQGVLRAAAAEPPQTVQIQALVARVAMDTRLS